MKKSIDQKQIRALLLLAAIGTSAAVGCSKEEGTSATAASAKAGSSTSGNSAGSKSKDFRKLNHNDVYHMSDEDIAKYFTASDIELAKHIRVEQMGNAGLFVAETIGSAYLLFRSVDADGIVESLIKSVEQLKGDEPELKSALERLKSLKVCV